MPNTSIADQTSNLDAVALAELVQSREVTPLELVDAAIERIERVNGLLNAVITPMFDLARRTAQATIPDGPFKGVPFLLKDLQAAFEGVPMTSGSRYLKDFVPNHDSEIVSRYKRAGLIVVGKTNTLNSIQPTTEPQLHGATKNPWDPSRTPVVQVADLPQPWLQGWCPRRMRMTEEGPSAFLLPAAASLD
jgi:amidase